MGVLQDGMGGFQDGIGVFPRGHGVFQDGIGSFQDKGLSKITILSKYPMIYSDVPVNGFALFNYTIYYLYYGTNFLIHFHP